MGVPDNRSRDAVRLGLVAGREHDTRADDHGVVTETRIVSLLEGREERVDVGVQDRRPGHGEHMSASRFGFV
jgi:hypothetical protein